MSKTLPPSKTGGPVVLTGPTAGQNRKRNKNGRWRKKRSDAGVPRTGSGSSVSSFSFFSSNKSFGNR